jgi:hypothetical protein
LLPAEPLDSIRLDADEVAEHFVAATVEVG